MGGPSINRCQDGAAASPIFETGLRATLKGDTMNLVCEIRAKDIDAATAERLHLAVWDAVTGQAGFTSRTKASFTAEAGSQSAAAALESGEVQVLLHKIE